jgi:uncharacterized protein YbaP (TraB family)
MGLNALRRWLSRERDLKMIWRVEREGRSSHLIGSAHFFPYHFRSDVTRYIAASRAVLVEGPLDETAAAAVARHGSGPRAGPSLVAALDARTRRRISRHFPPRSASLSSHAIAVGADGGDSGELDWQQLADLKPWMAFFRLWSEHLKRSGWTFSMELDVLRIAAGLGKRVDTLETIQEQLDALDSVPLERFVRFLETARWDRSRRAHERCYLAGDLTGQLEVARDFPTRCDAIIARRDPVLYERMRPFLDAGSALVFVGTAHVPGITARLLADGFTVRQVVGPQPGASSGLGRAAGPKSPLAPL